MADKRLIVVGECVLVKPAGEERTSVGLYLPPGAKEGMEIQLGKVIAVGPGIPIGAMTSSSDEDEPWKRTKSTPAKYFPLQAQKGDTATFFRKAAVQIKYNGEDLLVIPHGAILLLERAAVNEDGDRLARAAGELEEEEHN